MAIGHLPQLLASTELHEAVRGEELAHCECDVGLVRAVQVRRRDLVHFVRRSK